MSETTNQLVMVVNNGLEWLIMVVNNGIESMVVILRLVGSTSSMESQEINHDPSSPWFPTSSTYESSL